ncbi:MAG: Gfo/Idh/MocA family oxidoreductase [Bacteroidales bacterium]|nr:Gfo/Idh/MocA family oxidoreductase [Bacteroidales bacterium]
MQKINVALSSYGMSGLVFHGPLLETHPGYKITKILERNRKDSDGKHPESILVRNFDSILHDPDIELVVVNTPDHLHYEMVAKVINAGKHVVVEKPFTLRSAHADELIRLAGKKSVLLTVFQNRRWDGGFLTVKEIIETGKLGRLVEFESHFDRYRNYIQESWKEQSTGTGVLYNLGSHLVDQALQLFGMPDRLFCDSRMLRDGARTDDSYDLFLHYPAFKCLLRSSYLVREPGPRFILHGTEGSYLKWGNDPQEEALKSGKFPDSKAWGEEPESAWGKINSNFNGNRLEGAYPTQPGNYMVFYDNVYEAIRLGSPLQVTPEQARDVIRIIEAAYESSQQGKVVNL